MESYNYASFGRRFVALFIDGLIIGVTNIVLAIGLGIFGGILGVAAGENGAEAISMLLGLVIQVISILLYWLYEAFMLSNGGQTIGKKIMGIRVLTTDGESLTFLHATGRHFARLICGFTLCIGYIMAAFTERKQGLHDIVANTLVIKD